MKFFSFSTFNVVFISIAAISAAAILWCINVIMSLLLRFVCLILDCGR